MGFGCCNKQYCKCLRRNSQDSIDSSDFNIYYNQRKKMWPLWQHIVVWSLTALAILVFIAFILIWVVIPIVFWLSYTVQRFMIFIPIDQPKNPDFEHPQKYIDGTFNFYITVKDYDDYNTMTKIGAWLILPEDIKDNPPSNNITDLIKNTNHDILLYLHGVAANRAQPISPYKVFRKSFLVISIDHRGYGDSGKEVEQSEDAIVHDHLQIFDWIQEINSHSNIYYWGHSLGTGITCHTVRALKEQRGFVPSGVVLEAPFTTIGDEVKESKIGKIFRWLAYFNATVLYPLDYNGFHFYSTENILHIDCPIMIMHAEDDNVIPYYLGQTLAEVAKTKRNPKTQGSVRFYLFSKEHGYMHNDCTKDPMVPQYIEEFKDFCRNFKPAL